MTHHSPLGGLSPRVAASVEANPDVDAFLAGRKTTPNSWGAYATKVIDLELCTPTAAAVVALLGGPDLVDLRDPSVQFVEPRDFREYTEKFLDIKEREHEAGLRPERNRLYDEAKLIVSQWGVDPGEAEQRVGLLQQRIDQAATDDDTTLLCMERDGLDSGVEVTLAEFAGSMIGASVVDWEESPSELAFSWIEGIQAVVESVERDHNYSPEIDAFKLGDIYLSVSQMGSFLGSVSSSNRRLARVYAKEDWETVWPVFAAPTSLSVIDGNEQ